MARELLGASGRVAGLVAALLQALNPLSIRLVSGTVPTDHVDHAAVFFVEATVLLFAVAARRDRFGLYLLAGASLGLGYLTKSLPTLVALLAALPIIHRGAGRWTATPRRLVPSMMAFALVILPWQIHCARRWPQEFRFEAAYTWRHLFSAVEGHHQSVAFYLQLVPVHFGGPASIAYAVVLGSLLFAATQAVRHKDAGLLALLVWAVVPYGVFSLTATKLYAYVATAVPAVLLLIGHAVACAVAFCSPWRQGERRSRWAMGAAVVSIVAVGWHIGSVTLERFEADYGVCPWNRLYDYPSFRAAMIRIDAGAGPKVVFNVGDRKEIQAMFHADCTAYETVPSPAVVAALAGRGYHPFVLIDAAGRHRERIESLRRSEVAGRIGFVPIPAPRVRPRNHPYSE